MLGAADAYRVKASCAANQLRICRVLLSSFLLIHEGRYDLIDATRHIRHDFTSGKG